MVELQHEVAAYLPRNLSYSGNFHSFWQVHNITRRYLDTFGLTRIQVNARFKQDSVMSSKNCHSSMSNEELSPIESSARAELVPSRAECEAMRSLSIVSDSDTTFSEDYTRMTETSAENCESDFSTPLGSICSDLDDISIDSNLNLSNNDIEQKMNFLDGLPMSKIRRAMQNEDLDDRPQEPNSPEEDSPPQFGQMIHVNSFEDREFEFLRSEPVRRSTSLKTNKTPPGTPSRKKAVRFADALGLDLESVRHVLNLDVPPEIPGSALKDLKVGEDYKATQGNRYIAACFEQPGAMPDFIKRVLAEYVSLENCMIDDKTLALTGTIRVANISYHKYVTVRYSDTQWASHQDVCASYVVNSNDGATDRFSFQINIPNYFVVGSRMEFAVRFATQGQEYWDNNRGKNYMVECFARSCPIRDSDTEWIHFL